MLKGDGGPIVAQKKKKRERKREGRGEKEGKKEEMREGMREERGRGNKFLIFLFKIDLKKKKKLCNYFKNLKYCSCVFSLLIPSWFLKILFIKINYRAIQVFSSYKNL